MANPSVFKSFLLCYLSLLGFTLSANNHGVRFLFPTTNQILNYQDTVNVTWRSPFKNPLLYTFCYNSVTHDMIREGIQKVAPYNGSQLIPLVWKDVSSCNFNLRPNTTAGNGADSPLFIVLPTARAVPTTVGLGSPASTSGTTPTATGEGDSSTSDAPPLNSGLSSGAKAGIGVGVAVGLLAVLAGVALFLLQRRKAKNNVVNPTPPPVYAEGYYGGISGGQKYQPVDSTAGSDVQMQEMNADTSTAQPGELSAEVAHELPGSDVRR
ncbi:hypothetical protein F5882DRAFT_122929 [Hyaloscypha sp. PMI_1271]|nr:hypothetical protein F5882DRAFT_122929 [Hyaloscypha sp. PMI_1271]